MQEAYRVGVAIALSGDVGKIIGQLVTDFERLDKVVNGTRAQMGGLTDALRSMAAQGKSAADAWQNVAKSMAAAAKAARDAGAAGASMQPRSGRNASASAVSEAQRAIDSANAANNSQRGSPTGNLPVPVPGAQRGRYGDPYSGAPIGLPYSSSGRDLVPYATGPVSRLYGAAERDALEGDILPPHGPYALPGGGYSGGPTINGTWHRPGGNGPTYGPYGPGGAVGGGPVGGSPYGPGGGGAGGGSPLVPPGYGGVPAPPGGGGGGGMPPLVTPPWMNHQYQPGNAPGLHDFNGMAMLPDMAGFAWMKHNWEEAAKFEAEKSHLIQQGFTPEEANRAGQQAMAVQAAVGPISPQAVLHIIDKLMNVTQDKNVALNQDLLTEYTKAATVFSSYGHGDMLHGLDAAIRAGEFRGALTHEGKDGKQEIDVQGLNQFIRYLEAMASTSGGDINPIKVLQNLRSSGAAGTITSMDEMLRSMAIQVATGSAKAGTALQGFEQQFTAGRMNEAAANLLIQMGIIKGGGDAKHNPYLEKMGMGQFMMHPGAMPEGMQEEAAKNPSIFIMEQLLPKFEEKIKEVYGDRYTNGDEKTKLMYEVAMASQVASRIPGGTEMAEVIRNILLMQRDIDAARKNLQVDNFRIQMDNNPQNAARSLQSANQSLSIGLGESTMKPATDGLNALTTALNGLSLWTAQHAEVTKIGMEALGGALVALGAVGIIALAGTLGGLTGALAALGAAAAGGTEAVMLLDGWLHNTFGWLISSQADLDKTRKSMADHGMQMPWWAPLPVPPTGTREARPNWAQWGSLFGASPANGATNSAAAPGARPAAPTGSVMFDSGPKGTASDPTHTVVLNQLSPSEIGRGVSSYQASKANRPPSGYTGTDTRLDPMGAFYGMVNAP